MLGFIGGRLLGTVPVIVILSIGVFLMLHLTPGDPVQIMLGQDADPQRGAAGRDELGLDQPLPVQYVRWVGNVLRGDLGRSIRTHQPVMEAITSRLGWSPPPGATRRSTSPARGWPSSACRCRAFSWASC